MTLLALSLVSAGVLAYEVALTRALAIMQWDAVGPMAISIALLGFGVSGTLLTLARERVVRHFDGVFALSAAGFGVAAVLGVMAARELTLDVDQLVWQPSGLLRLPQLYLGLVTPFVLGGTCIGATLMCHRAPVGRIYRADLLGAGTGAVAIMAVLYLVAPGTAVLLAGVLGPTAAALHLAGRGRRRRASIACAAAGLALAALAATWRLELPIPEFKPLSRMLTLPDAHVGAESHSPLGWVAVVESPQVPLRHVPGASLTSPHPVPEQAAVFTDGVRMQAMLRFDGDTSTLAYLDHTVGALPYHLRHASTVFIAGAGAGVPILAALHHGALRVTANEGNRDVVDLVGGRYAEFSGAPYHRAGVMPVVGAGRAALRAARERYDLVIIAPAGDAFSASLLTVEGLHDALGVLHADGALAVTTELSTPPRAALKLLNTVLAALRAGGAGQPLRHLAVVRDWGTMVVVATRSPLRAHELQATRRFTERRAFDLVHLPGMLRAEANRRNVLPAPHLHDAVRALGGDDAGAFVARYKFDITASTDDRPFPHDTFRWSSLPEVLSLPSQGGAALLEWRYLLEWATLAQAAVLATVLIVAPLALGERPARSKMSGAVLAGFLGLGVAFLMVEVAVLQRLQLAYADPVLAFVVVVASFLVFAGLGAGWAAAGRRPWLSPRRMAVVVAVLVAGYALVLPWCTDRLLELPVWAGAVAGVVVIAPAAFCMGMPFPLALEQLRAAHPALAPWAWGINGCGSVLGPLLALVLAMDVGIAAVLWLAALTYVGAGFGLGRLAPSATATPARQR